MGHFYIIERSINSYVCLNRTNDADKVGDVFHLSLLIYDEDLMIVSIKVQ